MPLHWWPIIVRAHAVPAVPLLAVIAYQMEMNRRSWTSITLKTWARLRLGPELTKAQKHTMIEALWRIPSIVKLTFRQRTGWKYAAHQGVWWAKEPPMPKAFRAFESNEEDDGEE
jgi:hypothetical protein